MVKLDIGPTGKSHRKYSDPAKCNGDGRPRHKSVPCCLLFEADFSTTPKLRDKGEPIFRWEFLQVGLIPRASSINSHDICKLWETAFC